MGFVETWRQRRVAQRATIQADQLFRDGRKLLADDRAGEAEFHLAEAVRIRDTVLGPEAVDTIDGRLTWVLALRRLDRLAEAEAEVRSVIDHASAKPALRKLDGRARLLLASTLMSTERTPEAVAELDALLALAEQHSYGRLPLMACNLRATAFSVLGHHAEAAVQYAELATALEAEPRAGNARALQARASRAQQLAQLGRLDEAEAECRVLIQAATALDGSRRAADLNRSARNALVFTLVGQSRAVEAEAQARQAISLVERGPEYRFPLTLHLGLARALSAQHRHEEALGTADDARDAYTGSPGARRALLAAIGLVTGTAQLGLGRLDEAWQTTEQALADCRAALGPYHHRVLEVGTLHGSLLAARGQLALARQQLAVNATAWREHFGATHPKTRAAEHALASLG